MLQAQISIFRSTKYASASSGDRVEVVERARGGFSVVLVDGQGSGRAAKITSNLVTTKAIQLLAEGARDGAVARAVHDFLYTAKNGKVSATLTMLSVDLETNTLLVARNGHTPVYLLTSQGLTVLDEIVNPIGVHRSMKPAITEIPLEPGMRVLTFTDGVLDAGKRSGRQITHEEIVEIFLNSDSGAKELYSLAMERDQGRPTDDTTILGLAIIPLANEESSIHEMHLTFPVKGG
jgi:serine phosphatase RsbU (regulator of sigma subunit)